MVENKYTVNHSYMDSYKVYCFNINDKEYLNSPKYSYAYEKGDFIPLISNNYVYDKDLLIIDYKNSIVHIIEMARYSKSVKIKGKVDKSLYGNFKSKSYMVIDIYGNLLNVKNIYDVYDVINNYPNIDLYLVENKYINPQTKELIEDDGNGKSDDIYFSLDTINNYSANNLILSGYLYPRVEKSKGLSESISYPTKTSLDYAIDIKSCIEAPVIQNFEEKFIDKDSLSYKTNYLLELFSVNYYLESNPHKNLITYMSFGKKKATHIDKVKREIISFIDSLEEDEIPLVLESIISNVYDEDYLQSIIDVIMSILLTTE